MTKSKQRAGLLWLACALAAVAMTQAQTTYTETVLHNFSSATRGAYPYGGLVGDAAGNLYGTTSAGGADGAGVMFKVDKAGRQTVLYSFLPAIDIGDPQAGVVRDSAGNLYGTTLYGGAGFGAVYKLDTAGNYTDLHAFGMGWDGQSPYSGVIRDATGNLYGTTTKGGQWGWGVVYKLDTAGNYTWLYTFRGGADGGMPYAGLVLDSAGNLYGTTQYGGEPYTAEAPYGSGVVFKVDPTGHETVLYTFTGGADGGYPYAGVVRDAAGNLYGTSAGVVYKLDTAGRFSVLHSFTGGTDGGDPYAGVILDSAGNLYGTTQYGGTANAGVVYKVSKTGQETVLYSFTGGADGGVPYAGVIRDSAGSLYGTTSQGGSGNVGVVYKVDASGHETVLYSFPGEPTGDRPLASLTRDSAGNFYGTTGYGGSGDAGLVYKMNTAGQETVLYSFTGWADGGNPSSGVIRDSAGNLYGTTGSGGAAISSPNPACGVVYKLDPAGHETVLHSFTCGADGAYPSGGLIRDSAGSLYGTTSEGGTPGYGVVYKLDTSGALTVLYNFMGKADGGRPSAGVIRDSAGNLYGTTTYGGATTSISAGWGVVYKLDPAGHETVLYTFTGGADGGPPSYAGLVRDAAGNLYGTTQSGGTGGRGVVFRVDTAGHETVLHSFTGGTDGGNPQAVLIRDAAGNLYGTTRNGGLAGVFGAGVVYMLDPAGQETVLYSFTGGADGNEPDAGVIRDSAGHLFGTTYIGGKNGTGVIFKLTPQ